MIKDQIKAAIRDVKDFPKEGIVFKDITPILENPALTSAITLEFVRQMKGIKVDAIMGVESRGFFWGPMIAQELGIPFIPVRKKGKLPYKTVSFQYDLEYGSAEIEVHADAIKVGANILIHDDLLATGGTAAAAAEIVLKQKAHVAGFSFLVILDFLNGVEVLSKYNNNITGLVNNNITGLVNY
ncbi:adenine phosphoribosyltransferase [Vicingaceae bacterium]|nr:adenine phosphoribosyltransferase [Vicingaceae bacterium]MDB9963615.1 adenine phosphoribosyltransferase [Vicingaceae bacterium]MDC1451314.1 adenine phosphoribosyltransferase [Vicingaceae bacterium]